MVRRTRRRQRTKRTHAKRRHAKRTHARRSQRTKRRQRGGLSIDQIVHYGKKMVATIEPMQITYGTTPIKPNEDLTGKPFLYMKKPVINFHLRDDHTYLITLTDPDAPAGTWTHYVALIKANKIVKELYTYQPPSPPPNSGTHRYIFKVYLYDNADATKLQNTGALAGNVYYKQVLEPIIKNKDAFATFQYKVRTPILPK